MQNFALHKNVHCVPRSYIYISKYYLRCFFGASGFRNCFCRVAKSNLCPGFKYKNNWSRKDSIKYPKVKSEATRISSLLLVCYGHFVKFVFHRPMKIQNLQKVLRTEARFHSEVKLSYSIIEWVLPVQSSPVLGWGRINTKVSI